MDGHQRHGLWYRRFSSAPGQHRDNGTGQEAGFLHECLPEMIDAQPGNISVAVA
jgi:hypothetical protein